MKKIFVVDSKFPVLVSLNRWFTDKGFYVRTFSESKPLFDALHELLPDIIVMDTNLYNEDSREICKQIKNQFSEKLPVILFSTDLHTPEEIENEYAGRFQDKSFTLQKITNLLTLSMAN